MPKLFKDRRDRTMVLLLLIIAAVTHFLWLFSAGTFTSGDWWYISLERYRDFAHFSPIWITEGLGNTSAVPPFYFVRFLEGLTTYIGFTFALTEKLFFFIPIIFGSSLGAYLFLRQYFKPSMAFVGSIVFSFNTAMLFNYAGALTIGAAYGLAPVALYLFRQLLLNPKNKLLIIGSGLSFAIIGAYEQRILLLVLAMAFGLFIFKAAWTEKRWDYCRQRILPLAAVLAIFVGLHAFWLVPYAVNASSGVTFSDLLSRELFVSFSTIENSLTLSHPFWTGGRPATFITQPVHAYMFLVPIVAFGGFLFPAKYRRNFHEYKEIIYWGIVSLAGIFLVKQVNEPFAHVYPWLYNNLPGAAAFREASKFYLFNTLGYAVLIPFTITVFKAWVASHPVKRHETLRNRAPQIAYGVLTATVLILFLGQAKPLVTGSFRTLYASRTMPQDYEVFNEFINKQPDYFRVMWTPVNSRWAVQTNLHPSVTPSQLNSGVWMRSLDAGDEDPFPTLRDKSAALVGSTSSNDLLDRASVKYVVVPIRDTANEDDFIRKYGDDRQFYIEQLDNAAYLKKIDIGTKELAVYENTAYNPHVSSFNTVQAFNTDNNDTAFSRYYDLVVNDLRQDFNFVLANGKSTAGKAVPKTSIEDIFQGTKPADVSGGTLTQKHKTGSNAVLYAKANNRHLSYVLSNGTLTLYGQMENQLSIDGQQIDADESKTVLGVMDVQPGVTYIMSINGKPSTIPLNDTERDLGIVDGVVAMYALGGNTLPNPSFEQGLWQSRISDCNNYDSSPDIGMSKNTLTASDGKASLQFTAWKHTACTDSASVPIDSDNYLLSFDYQVTHGQQVGYEVLFNDPKNTVVKESFDTDHSYWQNYQKIVAVPEGATSYKVRLLGYSDYLLRYDAYTKYDNVQMKHLDQEMQTGAASTDFQKVPVPSSSELAFSYPVPNGTDGKNLVTNGDFANGLWQKRVGDCNNYDSNPSIKMSLLNRGQNNNALELSALRHAACTSSDSVPVSEFRTYMLSFDYQSPNAKEAHYRVEFNDPAKTSIEGKATVQGTKWQTYITQIQAPAEATGMRIVLFAFEGQYKVETIFNRYDNVLVKEIPPVVGQYYLVSESDSKVVEPKSVSFSAKNATGKTVKITGATTPFYLAMSESYNPLWKIRVDEGSGLRTMSPIPKPATLAEKYHLKLNDFENGWYIDPAVLCAKQSANCARQADGSYTMNLVIEYGAQRWFNAGTVISIVTLGTCIGYAGYDWRRRRHRAKTTSR